MAPPTNAYQSIIELKFAYCNTIDHGQPDNLANLFTDDAYIGVKGRPEITDYEGRDDINEWATIVPRADHSLHIATCPTISINGDTATGHWKYTVYLLNDGHMHLSLGEYDEQYRQTDGEWRISSRIANRLYLIDVGPIITTA